MANDQPVVSQPDGVEAVVNDSAYGVAVGATITLELVVVLFPEFPSPVTVTEAEIACVPAAEKLAFGVTTTV